MVMVAGFEGIAIILVAVKLFVSTEGMMFLVAVNRDSVWEATMWRTWQNAVLVRPSPDIENSLRWSGKSKRTETTKR
ncbi:hypothetical protein GCM10028895_50640 [Pontibacter rugosus]